MIATNICSAKITEVLRQFTLYKEHHQVRVKQFEPDGWWIGYRTTPEHIPFRSTYFDLNIKGDICYLLHIEVEASERGKGHGNQLYRLIEDIARMCGCTMLEQTPSGGPPHEPRSAYLERRGYTLRGGVAIKKLSL